MLIIRTTVRPSSIHGLGLFADQKILQGAIIWVMHKNLDQIISEEQWHVLPMPAKECLHTFMYWSRLKNNYVICLDNARYMNHSVIANTKTVFYERHDKIPEILRVSCGLSEKQWAQVDLSEGFTVATKNIEISEELLCNYVIDFPDQGSAHTQDF